MLQECLDQIQRIGRDNPILDKGGACKRGRRGNTPSHLLMGLLSVKKLREKLKEDEEF